MVLPLAHTSTLRPIVSVNWHPRFRLDDPAKKWPRGARAADEMIAGRARHRVAGPRAALRHAASHLGYQSASCRLVA